MSHYHDDDQNYCKVCGNRVDRGYRFCTRCGSQITAGLTKQVRQKQQPASLCPRCGAKRISGARFCFTCGHSFDKVPEKPNSDEYCSVCGTKKLEGALFCTKCGERLQQNNTHSEAHCPICGEPAKPGAKYCLRCGTSFDEDSSAFDGEICEKCGLPRRTFSDVCPRCKTPYGQKAEYVEVAEEVHTPKLRLTERICLNCGTGVSDQDALFCTRCGAPLGTSPKPDANAPASGLMSMLNNIDEEVNAAVSELSAELAKDIPSPGSTLSFGAERVNIPLRETDNPPSAAMPERDLIIADEGKAYEEAVENPVKYEDMYASDDEFQKPALDDSEDQKIQAAMDGVNSAIVEMPTMSTDIGDDIESTSVENGIILAWPEKAEASHAKEDRPSSPLSSAVSPSIRVFEGSATPWRDVTDDIVEALDPPKDEAPIREPLEEPLDDLLDKEPIYEEPAYEEPIYEEPIDEEPEEEHDTRPEKERETQIIVEDEPAAGPNDPKAIETGSDWFDILSLNHLKEAEAQKRPVEQPHKPIEPVTEWFDATECAPGMPPMASPELPPLQKEKPQTQAPRLIFDQKPVQRITPILSLDDNPPDHLEVLDEWMDDEDEDEDEEDISDEYNSDELGIDIDDEDLQDLSSGSFSIEEFSNLGTLTHEDLELNYTDSEEYTESSEDDQIVDMLGSPEVEICPHCGSMRKKSAKFCTKCGYRYL